MTPRDFLDVADEWAVALLEAVAWLQQALAALDDVERQIYARRYQHGESWGEISRALHIRPNTLAQRHRRLLQKLRDKDPRGGYGYGNGSRQTGPFVSNG